MVNVQFDMGILICNIIIYVVFVILLIVVGFGIYNILNMFIYEKMNDIVILKVMGFFGCDVMYIFISQVLMIGVLGGSLGLFFGWGMLVLISCLFFIMDVLFMVMIYLVNFDFIYYFIGIVFVLVFIFLVGYLFVCKVWYIDLVCIFRG